MTVIQWINLMCVLFAIFIDMFGDAFNCDTFNWRCGYISNGIWTLWKVMNTNCLSFRLKEWGASNCCKLKVVGFWCANSYSELTLISGQSVFVRSITFSIADDVMMDIVIFDTNLEYFLVLLIRHQLPTHLTWKYLISTANAYKWHQIEMLHRFHIVN